MLTYYWLAFWLKSEMRYCFHVNGFSITLHLWSRIVSSQRLTDEDKINGCRLGINSHADISCAGRHARVLETFNGRQCNVHPFHDSYAPITKVNTVNAALAHDTNDGKTFILNLNQSLDFTQSMQHSILCTNQARIHNVEINDIPTVLDRDSSQSIYFPTQDVRLSLLMHGPVPYLPVRSPTDEDLEECVHLDLTCGDHAWDPECLTTTDRGISSVSQSYYRDDGLTRLEIDNLQQREMLDLEYDLLGYDICDAIHETTGISAVKHTSHGELTPEYLSKLWSINIENAKRTLRATTQESIRILQGKITRRVQTRAHQNRYNQLRGYLGRFASDTFKSNVRSLRGNNYIQLFCNRGNYSKCFAMKKKEDAHHALDRFIHEVGIPHEMLTDGALELTKAEWGKTCRKHNIQQITTEPHSPWMNPSELAGGIIKRRVRSRMKATNTPIRLWDYCWEYESHLRSVTAMPHITLDDVTPYEKVHGYTPNIAELLTHKWYDWVWYHDPNDPDKSRLGRWLGPAYNCGQGLAYYILSDKGKVVTRSTVSIIAKMELDSDQIKERQIAFTDSMEAVIGNYCQATLDNHDSPSNDPYESIFEPSPDHIDDNQVEDQVIADIDHLLDVQSPINEKDDQYIGMKVPLQVQGELREGTVKSRKRTADGNLVGTPNNNPYMDTRTYEVDFGDGNYHEYMANNIVESLHSQVDDYGHTIALFQGISDHQSDDNAIPTERGMYETASGAKKHVITTKGWKLKCDWQDGTSSWVSLSDLKESNPIELAKYAKANGLKKEPAFAWWVNYTLRKRDRIVKQVHHRQVKKALKFGIQVPSTYKEAIALDKENGNDLWQKAVDKELKNVIVAFQLLQEGEQLPVGSKRIPYHLIFDVKFNLTRKARLVAGGHRSKHLVPTHEKYSTVASRDSVRICFMLAALNGLDVLSADIGNAYLNAPCREKIHVICGPELFGKEHEGKFAVICRALYGLATSGASWRDHFATAIQDELGFISSKADPDVHMKLVQRNDGTEYYAYLVVYVDDVLCIHHNPTSTMKQLGELFRLKDGVETPSLYLGTDIRKWDYESEDGQWKQCWAMGSQGYIKEAIRVCKSHMEKHKLQYPNFKRKGRMTPFSSEAYRPELDCTELCDGELATVYQNLIGILRWTCELGRIDILHETSILSQYLAQPRIGHLSQVLNIFRYLEAHDRSWMPLDPTTFEIAWQPKGSEAHPHDRANKMRDMYFDAEDELPPGMPQPKGFPVDINAFVDADHAGNKVTRRSHTGIIIYCNLAPVMWFSKKQNTVETSTFGSELIAMRICTEMIEGLRYKLRMFGVPLNGPARVFCDNEAVTKSSSYAETTLKKKHCSIAYHRIREAVAAGKMLVYYGNTKSNIADLLTKVLPYNKRTHLIEAILS